MAVREVPAGPPEVFLGAGAAVRSASQKELRPEVHLEEVPAPQRIAPYSMALSADVVSDGDELATGRFVLLHDPACPEAWDGPFRIVSYVRAALESELAADPMLGQVGWSWLQDALGSVDAGYGRLGRPHLEGGRHRRDGHPGGLGDVRRPGRAAAHGGTGDPGLLDAVRGLLGSRRAR